MGYGGFFLTFSKGKYFPIPFRDSSLPNAFSMRYAFRTYQLMHVLYL